MDGKASTMREALQWLREADYGEWAEVFEILVILGGDTDARDLDRDVSDFR